MGPGARALEFVWRDFGDLPMTDPFFKISQDQASASPLTSDPFRTGRETLTKVAAQPDVMPFSGVIFHMARTGSTLIHRLLSCTGKVQSLSEISLLDRALAVTENWPEEERNAALQELIAVYRRPRRPNERQFVTKMTDAGASIRIPQFRAAFPNVPWIFVYREPVEVMVSALSKPTGNLANWFKNRTSASRRLSMPALNDPGMWPAEFVARTLRRFCMTAAAAARETPPGLFLAVHYKRLPDAIWETIAPHFGIEVTEEDKELMRAESRFSAKKTDATEFKPDSAAKQEGATQMVHDLAQRFVAPAIEELKALPQA